MGQPGYQQIYSITLQQLAQAPNGRGQYDGLAQAVVQAAIAAGTIPASTPGRGAVNMTTGRNPDETRVAELVREALWDCLIKRLIVFGWDASNSAWPFYRLTEYGAVALKSAVPQPYDPNGFMAYFDMQCPGADATVRSYVAEAVLAFNSGCPRSSAVMLGCASEKLILLLCDAFEGAISDPVKRSRFAKDLSVKWMISHKYTTLRDRLDRMVDSRTLPRELAETVSNELPAGFELLRRCRNAAGHPEVVGDVSSDTVFLNIRSFTEYARHVVAMVRHFAASPADW